MSIRFCRQVLGRKHRKCAFCLPAHLSIVQASKNSSLSVQNVEVFLPLW
nr:MAG TPA: hypothetical protein [Caudoviricetes sp.]